MIYLDYAATSPLREEALEAMLPYFKEDFGNPDSLHSCGRRAAAALQSARDAIAAALGVQPSEVYFTSGGTEADNWAARGIARGEAAEKFLVSPVEHAAVLSAVSAHREHVVCRVGEDGVVSPDHVRDLLAASGGVSLVGVMAVNNETGCVQPIAELAAAAHAAGAYFFSDCVQAASSCDLKELARHADALALSAHKVGGPKGVGALVVKKGVPIAPLIAGGEQERGLRGGTSNVAGAVGFARALSLAQAEREAYIRHTGSLRDAFEQRILAELGSEVRADGARRVPNISHLTFARGGTAFLNALDLAGVACSGGAACSSHSAQPSHVLMAMGRSAEEVLRGVRFSFGRETTAEEAARAADTVIEKYRIFSRAQA